MNDQNVFKYIPFYKKTREFRKFKSVHFDECLKYFL